MAKVDKQGRIILYYTREGMPVYISSGTDDTEDNSNNDDTLRHDRGFTYDRSHDDNDSRTGDRHNDPNRDRNTKGDRHQPNHNHTNTSGNLAFYKLVRGRDGTLNVQYVDSKGNIIPPNKLSQYTISSVASSLKSVDDVRNGKFKDVTPDDPNDKKDKKDKKDKDVIQHGSNGDPWNEHSANGGFSGAPSKGAAPGGTGKNTETGSPSNPTSDAEQGDNDGTTTPDVSNNQPNSIYGDQDKLAGMLGQPNDPTVTGMTAPNYTKDQISDIGKTLAGEVDLSKTNPDTPEGLHEIAGIVSTMENRADAMGGDISKAIHEPNAYSALNPDHIDQTTKNYNANPSYWDGIAAGIVAHPQLRESFTNYFNPSLVNPSWAANLTDKTKIGPHMFGVDPTIDAKVKQAQVNASPPTVTTDQSGWTQSPIGIDRPTVTGGWNDMAQAGPMGLTTPSAPSVKGPTVDGGWNDMAKAGPFGGDWTDPGGRFVGGPVSPSDNSFNSMAQAGPVSSPDLGAPNYSPTTGFAQGYNPSISPSPTGVYGSPIGGFLSGQLDSTSNPTNNSFNSMAQAGPISSPSAQAASTTDRFGAPTNFDADRFGAPSYNGQPTSDATKTSVGTYGSLTGGFGTHVNTDPNAMANSGVVAEHNQNNISNPSSNVTSQAPSSQTSTTSTSTDNSNFGGLSSGPDISAGPGLGSTDSGASSTSSSTADSGADTSHDTGGFTGAPGDSTSTSTSGPTSTTDTGTTGVFGGPSGIFGGDNTDTSGTTGDTGATDSSSDSTAGGSSSFGGFGGFSDGFL